MRWCWKWGWAANIDATNVVAQPAMTIIQPVGLDHMEFLGNDIAAIAGEKAGIIKPRRAGGGRAAGRDRRAMSSCAAPTALSAPAFVFGQDFFARQEHGRMVYEDETGLLDLPLPKLIGRHQIENAGVAIAALRHARTAGWTGARTRRSKRACARVDWPARLQRLQPRPAGRPMRRKDAEIWLDGGHNPHGAAAVRRAIADLDEKVRPAALSDLRHAEDQGCGGFLSAFKGLARHVVTVAIPGEAASLGAGALYDAARSAGLDAAPAEDLEDAMLQVAAWARAHPKEPPPRILICGSLYLAGCGPAPEERLDTPISDF